MRSPVVVLLVLAVLSVTAVPTWKPIDGMDNTEFRSLPESGSAFLPPKEEAGSVTLPKEPTELTIQIGDSLAVVKYWFSADDTVEDVFKFIAERTNTSQADIVSLQHIQFDVIGRTYTEIAFSATKKLKDVPLIAGDELEVTLRPAAEAVALTIPNPTDSQTEEIPGFFLAKIKVAGMKMFSTPIPRQARGFALRGIIEDHCALAKYTVHLNRNTRDGLALNDNDMLTDKDTFFWAILVDKNRPAAPESDACATGTVRMLSNLGKSHLFNFDCHTTAAEATNAMRNIGLLPDETASPYGVMVSSKGFFDTQNVDTMLPLDSIVDRGVVDNGILFMTVACPTTTYFFTYLDKSLPQILNCTTTLEYLTPIFNKIANRDDGSIQPKFSFLDTQYHTKELVLNQPVMKQMLGITRLIINIDYPPADGPPTPTPVPTAPPAAAAPAAPPTPPSPVDAIGDRHSTPPADAVKLGDGTLLHLSKWRAEEESKYRMASH